MLVNIGCQEDRRPVPGESVGSMVVFDRKLRLDEASDWLRGSLEAPVFPCWQEVVYMSGLDKKGLESYQTSLAEGSGLYKEARCLLTFL
ncbi:hypothetical protein [Endozoicomonas elysicola]|uniref:hypothetical protein n=1 Tax=Endozoicomonas elysicola TaxID=305900 RepID=UPI0012F89BCE|nr:hypothetical protein [Endozoicomonas elysicola]